MLQPGVLSDFSWFTVLLPNEPVVVDDEIVWSSEGLKGYVMELCSLLLPDGTGMCSSLHLII
jgi:hypothetical protein